MNELFEGPEDEEEELEGEEGEIEDTDEDGLGNRAETEASLDEMLAKRSEAAEEEEDSILDLASEETLETLSIRAVPKQANEFVCSNCHLVKHLSQLANPTRELCRDCV
ncbi:MAG: DUF4193 family protein [Actinomycetota bacterium]